MLTRLFCAFAQLSDPRLKKVLGLGLLSTIATYLLLHLLVWWGLTQTKLFEVGWAETLFDIFGWILVFIVTVPFFAPLVTFVISFWLEEVASAVEARHYPDLGPPRSQALAETLGGAAKFLGVTIGANLLAMPFYVIFFFMIPGLNLVLFYLVNGLLLGREYFEMVAFRRLEPREAEAMRYRFRGPLLLAGVLITFLLSLPLVNLIAPIVATAFMLHTFEMLRNRKKLI